MTEWTRFVDQLPLLLVCIPFCGIVTIGLVNLVGREQLARTFLLNGVLSFACALLMLSQFDFGSERTRLSPAESFQSVVVFTHFDDASGTRFGVDGCSLLLILFVSALPVLLYGIWNGERASVRLTTSAGAPELTAGRAILVLLFQVLLLIFLTALDRSVQLVTLLSSTLVLLVILAVSLPSGRRDLLKGWQRQLLLSDFLIAGGVLASVAPLVRFAGIGTEPGEMFDLMQILEAVESTRDEGLTEYVRLMSTVVPSAAMILVGCSMRFGMFPFSQAARTMWEQTTPGQHLLIWSHGPVLGSAVVLRELQIFPLASYQIIGRLDVIWLFGMYASAVFVRVSDGRRREASLLVYLSSLLFLSLCGPNSISLAGSFLLSITLVGRLSVPQAAPTAIPVNRLVLSASKFLMTSGAVCTLVGLWQGVGAGSRGVGPALALGVSLLIAGYPRRETSLTARRDNSRMIPHAAPSAASGHGEFPIWNIPEPPKPETSAPRRLIAFRSVVMIIAFCLLLTLPNFLWQRIRGDLQKIEFPQGEMGLTASEGQP